MDVTETDITSLDAYPAIKRDEIFVTWNVAWTLERYVGWYLETRKHPQDDEWRQAVHQMIKGFPGVGALRKTDVDFFLDTNAPRWAPVWRTTLASQP